MKKIVLIIMSCVLMLLVTTGCQNKISNKTTTLEDTYKAISNYFNNSKVDKSNLGSFYIDDENNIIIVELVENTSENQEKFLNAVNIDQKYIEFRQGGPYKNNDIDIDLSVTFAETCGNVEFNEYLNKNDTKVYLEENINDLYIISGNEKRSFKDYATTANQSLEDSLKTVTDLLDKMGILKDGGTTIYKKEDKNITVIACNTLKGNKDIYIGDFQLDYKENMCK